MSGYHICDTKLTADAESNLASLFASAEGLSNLSIDKSGASTSDPPDQSATSQAYIQTKHTLHCGDAKDLSWIPDESVHLVVTSPPYWTLKKYNDNPDQMGDVADYETFLDQLDKVWEHCLRVLVPGGRLVCVVGDVCLSRRAHNGRHQVIPLHADISVRSRRIGFDYLTPILWYKISNATLEVDNGSSFLGKPYEPNSIIKNDIEYILMLRKSGGYRKPTNEQRILSKIAKDDYWTARASQKAKNIEGGRIDPGSRGAVVGGAQMGALEVLVTDILAEAGLESRHVKTRTALELPGCFRPVPAGRAHLVDLRSTQSLASRPKRRVDRSHRSEWTVSRFLRMNKVCPLSASGMKCSASVVNPV